MILTSLASGPKHGYGLTKDIEEFAGVKLGAGTCYGAIGRLEERGLIEPTGEQERRRPYRLTATGQAELTKALHAMDVITREGAVRLGLALSARMGRVRFGWSL